MKRLNKAVQFVRRYLFVIATSIQFLIVLVAQFVSDQQLGEAAIYRIMIVNICFLMLILAVLNEILLKIDAHAFARHLSTSGFARTYQSRHEMTQQVILEMKNPSCMKIKTFTGEHFLCNEEFRALLHERLVAGYPTQILALDPCSQYLKLRAKENKCHENVLRKRSEYYVETLKTVVRLACDQNPNAPRDVIRLFDSNVIWRYVLVDNRRIFLSGYPKDASADKLSVLEFQRSEERNTIIDGFERDFEAAWDLARNVSMDDSLKSDSQHHGCT